MCDEGRHKPREYPKYMRPEGQVDGSMDCNTCGITLNSATTYKSHIEGAKHLRKVQQQKKKEELMGRKHQQVRMYVQYRVKEHEFPICTRISVRSDIR